MKTAAGAPLFFLLLLVSAPDMGAGSGKETEPAALTPGGVRIRAGVLREGSGPMPPELELLSFTPPNVGHRGRAHPAPFGLTECRGSVPSNPLEKGGVNHPW